MSSQYGREGGGGGKQRQAYQELPNPARQDGGETMRGCSCLWSMVKRCETTPLHEPWHPSTSKGNGRKGSHGAIETHQRIVRKEGRDVSS